jgi:C4-dicarboxylate-specific signal transduction histidine kinase
MPLRVLVEPPKRRFDAMAGIDRRARILKASTSAADGHASVTVADTGVGIEPASEPHLFDAL